MASNRLWIASILLGWLVGCLPVAQASGEKAESPHPKIDYASITQDILRFEAVINEVITGMFSSSPFAVVHKAKGAYIQGHGFYFDFLINIHRAIVNTPFGQIRSLPDASPELKKQRIEELKEKLIRVIQDNGKSFQKLRKEEHVTIIAFVEDRNFPDEPRANKTIVMSALKKDLDELGQRNDRLKEFKQRIRIIEY